MGLCGWLARYWIQHLIHWKTLRVGSTVWVARQQAVQQISIILIREMCFIYPRLFPNVTWYSISGLWSAFPSNGSAAISYFSNVESVLKGVSNFLNFPVRNHSFTSSMMWSVWSTLKPRGDCQIRKYRYLSTGPYCTFISKGSSRTLVSSGNDAS